MNTLTMDKRTLIEQCVAMDSTLIKFFGQYNHKLLDSVKIVGSITPRILIIHNYIYTQSNRDGVYCLKLQSDIELLNLLSRLVIASYNE